MACSTFATACAVRRVARLRPERGGGRAGGLSVRLAGYGGAAAGGGTPQRSRFRNASSKSVAGSRKQVQKQRRCTLQVVQPVCAGYACYRTR
jgi:hypothetical protein